MPGRRLRRPHAQPRRAVWEHRRLASLIPDNLKSRKDVASIFQRIAEALELALDDDALVWYEPLYDPTARGGRGERPHFIVLEPRRGIVVLEVVDVEKSALLGVLRGRMRVARDGREVEVDNPVRRATAFADVLRTRLEAEPVLSSRRVPVGSVAVFPRLTADEARERGVDRLVPLEQALFVDDVKAALSGEGSARVLRVFARVLGSGRLDELPDDAEKRLRMVVQPDIAIERVAAEQLALFRAVETRDDHVRALDRQQENIAKGLGSGHRVLRGVAGSGKTLMLVYRARLVAQANPQWKILFTCYTRSLASHLRVLLAAHRNVEVAHVDRVMQRVIAAAKMKHPGYDQDDAVVAVARQALASGAGPRYQCVLLDEGQDFGIETLRFVTELLAEGHNDLVIAMDGAQNIFRRKFSLKQAGVQAAGRTRVLKRNYRNTGEIGAFAYRFLTGGAKASGGTEDEGGILEPELDVHAGSRPRVVLCDGLGEEVAAAVRQVRDWLGDAATLQAGGAGDAAPGDAATAQAGGAGDAATAQVRGPGDAATAHVGSATPRGIAVLYTRPDPERARRLHRGLLEAGVEVFWVNDPDHAENRDLVGQAAQPVVLSTVYSAKGFEYPRVVLVGVYDPIAGREESRNLAYVGMTRATEELLVVADRKEPLAPRSVSLD